MAFSRSPSSTPGGKIIRSEKGSTGIDTMASELKRQMKSEYAEKVETVYSDIYFYPLGLAIFNRGEVYAKRHGKLKRSG